jgi:N-acyl-D-amino-acid deacylase
MQYARTHRLIRLLMAGIALLAAVAPGNAAEPSYDLWIRNGTVVDGTGRDRFRADVLVNGDTIELVADLAGKAVNARRTIDAAGKLVVPGFIDTHAHGDPLGESFTNFLAQGITTVVLGQDGWAPYTDAADGAKLAQWLNSVDRRGSEVNIATLTGHATLRMRAGVDDSPHPTAAQLDAMKSILREDMAAGAYGLSFGLEYAPGRYSLPAEQKALGDVVGASGGIVMSHMRSEDFDKIGAAIDELLQIDAHVHVSHLKIVAGHRAEEAHAVLSRLAQARALGRAVTADVYPYTASASNFVFLYPDWAKRKEDYERAVRERRPELEAHIRKRVSERNGPEAILFTSGPHAGKRLSDVARASGKPYEKAMIDDLGYGGPGQAHFLMSPAVHDVFIAADHVNICTDGAPGPGHPRSYDSFIKVLVEHVGPAPKMSLERAIHKMSGLPGANLGLDRGTLAAGAKADLLLLSPQHLQSRATWHDQQRSPAGIELILVNGQLAFEHDRPAERRHGRTLRFTSGDHHVAR